MISHCIPPNNFFYYLISNSLNYKELAQDILKCQDSLEMQSKMKDLNDNQPDIEHMEIIMRFTVLQKFLQSEEFRQEIIRNQDKEIIYYQPNLIIKQLEYGVVMHVHE